MIVTERFVFIHMHKTGGQTLNNVIQSCISDHRELGYHFPRSKVPPESCHLPLVGFVRNPWSWYVSWYFFNQRPNMRNPLFETVSEGGRLDFSTTVRNLINLASDSAESRNHRDRLIEILPDILDGNHGVGLTKSDIESLSESRLSYYSWLFDRMLGIEFDKRTYVGKFENLQTDFLDIMHQLHVAEEDAISQALENPSRKNPSRHSHYSHYYDDELRQYIADKDARLISRFGYEYETVGPDNPSAVARTAPPVHQHQEFRKLLGRAENFLLINSKFDIGPLREKVELIADETWAESDRGQRFYVHRSTQSILLIKFVEYISKQPEKQPLYGEFEDQLRPVTEHIANYYQDNGFVLRLLLAKLRSGGRIDEHVDTGFSLLNSHRIHIPIISNTSTAFHVGDTTKNMQAGEFWEIDNGRTHAVRNDGDKDRIHLIVDWMPNHTGLPRKDLLDPTNFTEAADRPHDAKALNALIAQAYQYQCAGQVHRAEAGYRYVLETDPDHVICNNLMGMLCRQTHRYEEAVPYIEKALALDPKDAKAHSNLGQALLSLGKFAESARSFQNALSLRPTFEAARVGLQRAQRELSELTRSRPGH